MLYIQLQVLGKRKYCSNFLPGGTFWTRESEHPIKNKVELREQRLSLGEAEAAGSCGAKFQTGESYVDKKLHKSA